MARLPYNSHVFVCRKTDNGYEYLLLQYAGSDIWQGVSGGGEGTEIPVETAVRETREETGISGDYSFYQLSTVAPVPVTEITDGPLWGDDLYVIPQYYFVVIVPDHEVTLSVEHDDYRWATYEEARELIPFDSTRTALWEADRKLRGLGPWD